MLEAVGDLMEPTDVIFPLGNLVQLKTDAFGTISGIERIENLRVVITHRFMRQDEQENVYVYFSQIEIPLDEIRQNNASVLMEALNNYRVHGETAIAMLQKKDEEYAIQMRGEGNGK